MSQFKAGSADETMYPVGDEVGCSVCGVPSSEGAVYEHWGSRTCPSGSSLLYEGFAAGKMYSDMGGSSNTVCMHSDPQALPNVGTATSGTEYRNILHGAEYGFHDNIPGTSAATTVANLGDVACAMCQGDDTLMTYVQWGRSDSCSNGHTTLYTGYAMGERSDYDPPSGSSRGGHYSADMVCIDKEVAVHATSSTADDNGRLFFMSQFKAGSADETMYPVGDEVGCSVCGVA